MTQDQFVERLLDETRDEIERADLKASILLTFIGVAIASDIGALFAADVHADRVWWVVWLLGAVSTTGLTVSVGSLGAAVLPRVAQPRPGRASYFMDHAQYDDIDDLRRAVDAESTKAHDRHLQQLWHLARIVRTKYRLSALGIVSAGVGLTGSALTALAYFVSNS